MTERSFKPQQNILEEGATGSEVFILIEGKVSIYKKTGEGESYKVVVLDATHHPFFGETALLDTDARSASITADETCRCLVLDREHFDQFGREHPDWAFPIVMKIASTLVKRLKQANQDLMLLYHALVGEIRGH